MLRGEQLEMVAESHLRQIVQGEFLTETVAASMVPAEFKSRLATIMTPLLEGRQGAATRLQNPAEFQAEPKSRVAVPAELGAIIAPAQTAALFDFRSGAAVSTQPLAEFRQIERGRSKPPIEAQGGASRAAIVLTEFALQGPAPEPANAAVLIISDDVLVRLEVTDFN